ncbi:MAG: hypothetical protein CVU60_03270 [Deltaproteobacteria bacterium HGW-Deltaproteobacteria-18]|jgi:O-antigen/teichoic acid export membrane protein|nr:MAG: hypothetical protein CVU60_03270 [Deltaproteobacteria bacterium HGW-Deltaproteobacteria-18]
MSRIVIFNTIYAQGSQLAMMVMQAVYFIIIARSLSPEGYGSYLSVLALVSFFMVFSAFGSERLMIRDISLNRNKFNIYWGSALLSLFLLCLVVIFLIVIIGKYFFENNIDIKLLLFIAISDCLFAQIVNIHSYAFQAMQKINYMGFCKILLSFCRLISVIVFLYYSSTLTAEAWAIFNLIASFFGALFVTIFAIKCNGLPILNLYYFKNIFSGLSFAATSSAVYASNDIDKVMLSSIVGQSAVGIYGAAYKLINISFTPILSLLISTYAIFFEKSTVSIKAVFDYAFKLSIVALPFGLIISISILFFAPVVPFILGDKYASSVTAMRLLSFLPVIKIFQYFGGDALTALNMQNHRLSVVVISTAINVILNFVLIPLYSWKGAILSTLICDLFIALSIWTLLVFKVKKSAEV